MSECNPGIAGNLWVWSSIFRPPKRVPVGADAVGDAPLCTCSAIYLGKQEEMVLDTLVCRCLSFCFPLVYSIGLQVGPPTL